MLELPPGSPLGDGIISLSVWPELSKDDDFPEEDPADLRDLDELDDLEDLLPPRGPHSLDRRPGERS